MRKELSRMEKRDIEKQVSVLLEQNGYSQETNDYVDIVQFVQKLGFVVGNAALDDKEDGFLAIQHDELNDRIIGVNSKRPLDLKRFIIAHEFAHSILHYEYKEGELYLHRENKKGKSTEENDADYFAAALLMPFKSFKRKYDELEKAGLNRNAICLQLASIYKVPYESATRRIDEVNS